MKNHRDVCYAKDAGFIEFEGLEGSIKTGCAATPKYKSLYCEQHENQACNLLYSDEIVPEENLGVQTGPEQRSKSNTTRKEKGSMIAELILGKKATRTQTYYQVCKYIRHVCMHMYVRTYIYAYINEYACTYVSMQCLKY